jgi:hypothetical protein
MCVDANRSSYRSCVRSQHGCTALMRAAEQEDLDTLAILVHLGADINAKSERVRLRGCMSGGRQAVTATH